MPKIFVPSIGSFKLGPAIKPSYELDSIAFSAKTSIAFSLKDYYYYKYQSSFSASVNLKYNAYYGWPRLCSEDIDYYCGGTKETKSVETFVLKDPPLSEKEFNAKESNLSTNPITIFELICGIQRNNWFASIKRISKFTNRLGEVKDAPPYVYGCKVLERNCCQDTKQVWDEEKQKWITVELSKNPDTKYSSCNEADTAEINFTSLDAYLNPSNYTIQGGFQFGGQWAYLTFNSKEPYPEDCRTTIQSNLTFLGKTINSKAVDNIIICEWDGNYSYTITWTAGSKLNLI